MDINGSNSHLLFIKCRHFDFDEIAYGTDTQTGRKTSPPAGLMVILPLLS